MHRGNTKLSHRNKEIKNFYQTPSHNKSQVIGQQKPETDAEQHP